MSKMALFTHLTISMLFEVSASRGFILRVYRVIRVITSYSIVIRFIILHYISIVQYINIIIL